MDRNATHTLLPTEYNQILSIRCLPEYKSNTALRCGNNGIFSYNPSIDSCVEIDNDEIIAENKNKQKYIVYGSSAAGIVATCFILILLLILIIRKRKRKPKKLPNKIQEGNNTIALSAISDSCNSDVYNNLNRNPKTESCVYSNVATVRHKDKPKAPDDDTYNIPYPDAGDTNYDVNDMHSTVNKVKDQRQRASAKDDKHMIPPLDDDNIYNDDNNTYNRLDRHEKPSLSSNQDDIYNIPDENRSEYNDDTNDMYSRLHKPGKQKYPSPTADDTYSVLSKEKNFRDVAPDDDPVYSTLNK